MNRRLDTKLAIYSPPAADVAAVQDAYGVVDRSAANWEFVGYAWAEVTVGGAGEREIGGQPGNVMTASVEMHRRTDVSLSYRFEVLSGPYAGRFLYPMSIGFDGAKTRTMAVACQMAERATS